VLSGLALDLTQRGEITPEGVAALVALTALVSAGLQLVYGALRAGRLIKYIPHQVVSGYLSGVGLIIAVGQLPKLLGAPTGTALLDSLTSPGLWQWPSIVVGVVTIAVTLLAPRVIKRVPAAILGLLAGILCYLGLGLAVPALLSMEGNALLLGPVQASGSLLDASIDRGRGLLELSWSDVALVLAPAGTLSVLLSIDTLKTGVVLDALTRRRHNSNRELIAQGTANAVSFALGGMAGAGTMGPSLVNVTSGGKTIASSVLAGAFALLAFVALGDVIAWVPVGALAGILLVVAFRMFDFKMFRLLRHRSTYLDFVVIATVVAVAEGVGLIQASVVGISLSILLVIRSQIQSSVIRAKRDLRSVRSKRRRGEAANHLLDEVGDAAVLVELRDDLFFGTTDQLLTELERDLNERRFILLDLRRVDSVDYTAAGFFEQMRSRLHERDGWLLMCGMPSRSASRQDIEHYLEELGVGHAEGLKVFETRDAGLEWMEDHLLEAAGHRPTEVSLALELDQLPFFAGLEEAELTRLRGMLSESTHAPGDTILGHGEAGASLVFVRAGRVRILLPLDGGKSHHLATFCAGEVFGEMTFLDGGVRSADAVAATEVQLYVLRREDFDQLATEDAEVAAHVYERIAHVVAERLRHADLELRSLEDR
jgi:SulP family sulfate permease